MVSFLAVLLVVVTGCKSKEKEGSEETGFFPVLSFIKSQVAHVDTSVYAIVQVTKKDSLYDTVYLKREDFKTAAADFLSLPDITSKKLKKQYEETKMFDDALQRVVISYTPKDKEDVEIQRQEVIIKPGQQSDDEVQTIYIDRVQNNGDSTVQKRMVWDVDKRFQIISIIQKKQAPERVQTVDVNWNSNHTAE